MARPLKIRINETVSELEKRLSKSITAREKVSEIVLKTDELTLASLTKWDYLIEAILSVTS